MPPSIISWTLLFSAVALPGLVANEANYYLQTDQDWQQATNVAHGVTVRDNGLQLDHPQQGTWTSKWHDWKETVESAKISVHTQIELFDNKTIEILVDGSETPFIDADGVAHDWYGRCMIAVLDERRWVLALRSGVNHISWQDRDAIHVITSDDEGRTWNDLNCWFDGSPIEGMPYEDGYCHSEPGLYRMPNGDLVLQFWRTNYRTGTKQLRSTNGGKTWNVDLERLKVNGVDGADDACAIGTEDYFVDPEHPTHVYMSFQYFHWQEQSGTLLARSDDNGKSYQFLSWIAPLTNESEIDSTFEPAVEYLGNRSILAILRPASNNRHTWKSISTNMGISFSPLEEISSDVNGGMPNGVWQRVRLYKESNPFFQFQNQRNYTAGEGRLWGFGIHSNGGGYTRKPVVYWSDDHGNSWNGPESLHGEMFPGTDTGYGDIKRRMNGTFVAATYYATRDSQIADLEQYTFGGERAQWMLEADRDGDGRPDTTTCWYELYGGANETSVSSLQGRYWRIRMKLNATETSGSPRIDQLKIEIDPSQ